MSTIAYLERSNEPGYSKGQYHRQLSLYIQMSIVPAAFGLSLCKLSDSNGMLLV